MVPALICFASVLAAVEPASSVIVRGDTECPTAAELSAALVGLVAPASPGGAPDVAELRGHGAEVIVQLANAQGDVIAEKPVPESGSCAERARTAAVIVAAWEAHLRGGMSGDLAVPPPRESPPVVAPVPGAPTPPVAPPPLPAVAAPVAAAPASPFKLEAGAGVFASFVSTQAAPAGLAELVVSRRGGRFSLGVEASPSARTAWPSTAV
ncbi:MAG TPA: hypothetical protein VK989_15795, partial [Polyangia bacterium]|nr:hypothetical protein [Polyangia bacterium]